MKWYQGGIPQAIQASRQANSVFIVYVAGEDDKSREMESHLNSPEVTTFCEENKCVAVKILGNSNECKFFSQIYPVVVIPSTFFIGNTGVPLEVIGEVTSAEEFLTKVKNAIELHKTSSGPPRDVPEPSQSQSVASPAAAQKQEVPASQPEPAASSDEDQARKPAEQAEEEKEAAAVETGSGDEASPEKKARPSEDEIQAKVERAKELVAKKREEKAQTEAEKERERELERRAMGQGVQKLREQQKEMEILEARRELKKDRDEDKLARQRVKEQIARDRAEKAARFGKEKEERDQAREDARKKKLLEEQQAQWEEQARRSDTARLQFRRPDGSSISQSFPATATFDEVYAFITQEMGGPVTLSTTFPRRTFTREDHSSTLQQLQLVPSAAILVMPIGMSTSGVTGSSVSLRMSSLTGYLFAPFFFVWNLIASLFGLSGSTGSSSRPASASASRGPGASTATGGERDRGGAVKRTSAGVSGTSQQIGSIHRFRNAQDDQDPDDNNTWNGNSTQQM